MKDKLFVILILIFVGAVMVITAFVFKLIQQRNDLAFLQINLTETFLEAKKCLSKGGVLQNPLGGEIGRVYLCNQSNITTATYPLLKKLSPKKINYQYLVNKKYPLRVADDFFINIGRKGKILMQCNVRTTQCIIR